jgi:hypothetical protein
MRAIFNHVNKKMHVWLDRTRDVLLTASCGGTWSSSSSCEWAAMVEVMALVGFVELTLLVWVVLCVVLCVEFVGVNGVSTRLVPHQAAPPPPREER